ncbi:MAG TPA: hypothetical protein VFU47_02965 [Armatimonadota bacterium]|nr:hypothetical protein [Armatimonadota bacterium]
MDEERKNPWPLAWGLTALCCFTLVGGLAFIAVASAPEPVKPISSFGTFTAKDKAFACAYPANWKSRSFGGSNGTLSGGVFQQGSASISVEADLAGSLMGDIMKAPGAMMSDIGSQPGMGAVAGPAMKPPVEKLHEAAAAKMEKEYPDYQEQPAQAFQTRIGEGRYSEFTHAGALGSKYHGFRATILGGERRIEVICDAPERDWDLVRKPFLQVIGSVSPGGA